MSGIVKPCTEPQIAGWRERYRAEMSCQIVHDSLHQREGWSQPFLLFDGGTEVGYGSILIGGPWRGSRTVFEFYVSPDQRDRSFRLFTELVKASEATAIQAQTSDALLTTMLHCWCEGVRSEKIVFAAGNTTSLPSHGACVRPARPDDGPNIFQHHGEPVGDHVLELDRKIIATGGIAFHYNPPYGDIYMEVDPPYRRRGYGSYLVQELKRICGERGSIPCARCDTANGASRNTIQKSGMVPVAHILTGAIASAR